MNQAAQVFFSRQVLGALPAVENVKFNHPLPGHRFASIAFGYPNAHQGRTPDPRTTLDIYAYAFDKNKREAQEKLGRVRGL